MKKLIVLVALVLSASMVHAEGCLPTNEPLDWNGCPVYLSCMQPQTDGPYVILQAVWSTGRIGGSRLGVRSVPSHSYVSWGMMGNIFANDGNYAKATFYSLPNTVLMQVYGFDFTMVPDNAVVKGLEVRFEGHRSGNVAVDYLRLFTSPGVVVGANLAPTPIYLAGIDAVYSVGGPTANLGLTLTPALVKSPTFGVEIGARSYAINSMAYLDQVALVVYYSCQ